jgi:NinB protein
VIYFGVMHDAEQGRAVLERAWMAAELLLSDGHKVQLSVKKAQRSGEQNAKLHAELDEIAASVEWFGKKRDTETWKRLMTAAWLRARGESIEVLPALDGAVVDIVFRRTSDLTKEECSELLEYVMAWKAENMEQR